MTESKESKFKGGGILSEERTTCLEMMDLSIISMISVSGQYNIKTESSSLKYLYALG